MFRREGVRAPRRNRTAGLYDPLQPLKVRGSLPEDWKSYKLQASTVALIRAMRQSLHRQFLSYDELLVELATFYLHYHRILNSQVERILQQESDAPAEPDHDSEP